MKEQIYYVVAILLGILVGVSAGFIITELNESSPQIKVSELKPLLSENSKTYIKEVPVSHSLGDGLSKDSSSVSEWKASSGIFQVTREIPSSVNWVPGGDVNRDEEVNMKDLREVAKNYGRAPPDSRADLDGNGLVDIYDLVGVGLNFGKGGRHGS